MQRGCIIGHLCVGGARHHDTPDHQPAHYRGRTPRRPPTHHRRTHSHAMTSTKSRQLCTGAATRTRGKSGRLRVSAATSVLSGRMAVSGEGTIIVRRTRGLRHTDDRGEANDTMSARATARCRYWPAINAKATTRGRGFGLWGESNCRKFYSSCATSEPPDLPPLLVDH